jgi:hypothetical protein
MKVLCFLSVVFMAVIILDAVWPCRFSSRTMLLFIFSAILIIFFMLRTTVWDRSRMVLRVLIHQNDAASDPQLGTKK